VGIEACMLQWVSKLPSKCNTLQNVHNVHNKANEEWTFMM